MSQLKKRKADNNNHHRHDSTDNATDEEMTTVDGSHCDEKGDAMDKDVVKKENPIESPIVEQKASVLGYLIDDKPNKLILAKVPADINGRKRREEFSYTESTEDKDNAIDLALNYIREKVAPLPEPDDDEINNNNGIIYSADYFMKESIKAQIKKWTDKFTDHTNACSDYTNGCFIFDIEGDITPSEFKTYILPKIKHFGVKMIHEVVDVTLHKANLMLQGIKIGDSTLSEEIKSASLNGKRSIVVKRSIFDQIKNNQKSPQLTPESPKMTPNHYVNKGYTRPFHQGAALLQVLGFFLYEESSDSVDFTLSW
jgi:hypothetical protein